MASRAPHALYMTYNAQAWRLVSRQVQRRRLHFSLSLFLASSGPVESISYLGDSIFFPIIDLTSAHLSCQVAGVLGPGISQRTPRPSSHPHRPGWAQCHCPRPSTGCLAESLLTSVWQGPPLQPSTAHQCRMVSSKDLDPDLAPLLWTQEARRQKEELPEAEQPSLHA